MRDADDLPAVQAKGHAPDRTGVSFECERPLCEPCSVLSAPSPVGIGCRGCRLLTTAGRLGCNNTTVVRHTLLPLFPGRAQTKPPPDCFCPTGVLAFSLSTIPVPSPENIRRRVTSLAAKVVVPAPEHVRCAISGLPAKVVVSAPEHVWCAVSGLTAKIVVSAPEHVWCAVSSLTTNVVVLTTKDVAPGPTIRSSGAAQRHATNTDHHCCQK